MNDAEIFSQLHYGNEPLLIGNVWDAASAKIFEEMGFKAVATSSAALANSLGYEDGENLPFDLLLETVKRIKKKISIPLSVDLERGYSSTLPDIIHNIENVYNAGAAGINIEDSAQGLKLRSCKSFQNIISSIANHLSRKNMQLFINARTDAFLLKIPNAVNETIVRAKAYEAAGANGIFVPFISDIAEIKKVVEATSLPVNVLFMQQLPGFKTLSDAGVKRISMGSSVYNFLKRTMVKNISVIMQEQSAVSIF